MVPGQQAPPHRWTDYLSVGRMPLPVAYLFSLVGAVGMTFALAEIDADTVGPALTKGTSRLGQRLPGTVAPEGSLEPEHTPRGDGPVTNFG